MAHTIKELAEAVGGTAVGATDLCVSGAAEPAAASATDIALALKPAFAATLAQGGARAAILWAEADWQAYGLAAAILVTRPRLAMAGLTALFDRGQGYTAGIHPSAIVDPEARIGRNVAIGAMSYVAAGADIGDDTVIGPQCYIGTEARLGTGAVLHSGVRIMARVRIGARFRASPGVVVGADGHSFVTPEESSVEQARASLGTDVTAKGQTWQRIHSLGAVFIGDDVELGANTTVDAGTIRPTEIGNGVKVDNLCQIGHNVRIGNDCLFSAQTGVAGSTVIGNNVILGGHVGVSDNITVGDNVVVGGGSKILSKVPAGRVMLGYPATKMDQNLEIYKLQRRLPRLFEQVTALQKAVFKTGENE